MAAQRKNLLEAFQNAGDLPEPKPSPEASPTGPEARVSPPSASPSLFEKLQAKRSAERAGAAQETEGEPSEKRSRAPRITLPSLSLPGGIPPALLLAAGAGVVLAIGVAIGRASRPEVEAAGADDREGSLAGLMDQQEGTAPGGAGIVPADGEVSRVSARNLGVRGTRDTLDAGGRTRIEDSPLFDPANHYTVIVQTYGQANKDHAWATFEHLRSEGLPVFPPVVKDEYLLILVGAAPSSKDLAAVQERIRKLPRDGQYAYHDAYRAPIDNYIER